MARDFDIRRRPSVKPPARFSRRSFRPRGRLLITLFVSIFIVVLTVLIQNTSRGNPSASSNPLSEPTITPNSSTPTSTIGSRQAGDSDLRNLFNNDSNEFTVQVYNGGAGREETEKIIKRLKDKGYEVINLGDSQFTYETTDIWYRQEFEKQAMEISVALSDRQVKTKESKISGVFDVLVYIGKH